MLDLLRDVRLAHLSAAPAGRAVVVRWRTATETDLIGFNLYRSAGARSAKLNASLISAKTSGRPAPASYAFVDRRVRPDTSYTYRLQAVDLSGKRSWSGSVSLRAPR